MPFSQVLCRGPAGWALRIADSDARQTMDVVSPGGIATRLDLTTISHGAFSSFGTTAEWRGSRRDPFAPDSLVVRFFVSDRPHPAPPTSHLVAVRLAPRPCVILAVPPGPNQNSTARKAANGQKPCLRER